MTAAIKIFEHEYTMRKGYLIGTHRTRPPIQTIRDYMPLMFRMGITRLANLTGLDNVGLPVYTAIRPNSRSLTASQGKGFDPESAKASALLESVEAWHAEQVQKPLHSGSYLKFSDCAPVVDVFELPLRKHGTPFRPDRSMQWIEGYDLAQKKPVWVPYEMVTLDAALPLSFQITFDMSSNGLAAGNHLLEAVLHGLCEVIERDAEMLWRLSDDWRQMDMSTVSDACCIHTIQMLTSANSHVAAWNLTTEIGVPVFGCLIMENPANPSGRPLGVYYGFGCHPSPDIALLRALMEAIQCRVTYIAGSRDDLSRSDYQRISDRSVLREIWNENFERSATERFGSGRPISSESFEEDIAGVLTALDRAGFSSVIVVDLTKPEIGIPVAKVIVPGLEGTYSHCRPGKRAARAGKVKQ